MRLVLLAFLISAQAHAAIALSSASVQYVNLSSTSSIVQNKATVTVMGWTNITNLAADRRLMGISINGSNTTNRITFSVLAAGNLRCGARALDGQALQVALSVPTVSTGSWHHLACVINYSSNSITDYIDGAAVSTTGAIAFTSSASSNTTSNRWAIGAQADGSAEHMNGQIDDIRVYTQALSAARIATIYASRGRDGDIQGLVGRWTFRDGPAGSSASGAGQNKDLAGTNNGTPTANPLFQGSILRFKR